MSVSITTKLGKQYFFFQGLTLKTAQLYSIFFSCRCLNKELLKCATEFDDGISVRLDGHNIKDAFLDFMKYAWSEIHRSSSWSNMNAQKLCEILWPSYHQYTMTWKHIPINNCRGIYNRLFSRRINNRHRVKPSFFPMMVTDCTEIMMTTSTTRGLPLSNITGCRSNPTNAVVGVIF